MWSGLLWQITKIVMHDQLQFKHKILFVCTGNICRSPSAEGVFRKMIEEHFLVQGKPTKSKNLSQSLENTLAGKTKDVKIIKEIISKVKKLED